MFRYDRVKENVIFHNTLAIADDHCGVLETIDRVITEINSIQFFPPADVLLCIPFGYLGSIILQIYFEWVRL